MQRNVIGIRYSDLAGKKTAWTILFSFSILLFSVSTLLAETLIPITVQKGTNLIFLTREYCTSKYHWKELAKINNLSPPYKILPGDIIYAPVELVKTEKLSAKVASVIGGVFIVHNGQKLRRVSKGDEIYPGQTLVTEDDGFTHIIFPDNKYTRISSGSKFTLTYLVRLTDKSLKAEFFLERGRITHAVKKELEKNETFTTRTPVSVTGVRGTEFRLKLSDDNINTVETLKGVVTVKGDSGELFLKKGEGTKVEAGNKPQTPKRLPVPPQIPAVQEMFQVLPVVLAAPSETDVERYRLRITTDRDGNNTILEKLASPGGTFTLLALPDGTYYGFLTAIDAEKFESPPAVPFNFEVRTIPGPPIFISPHEGKSTFDTSVQVDWLKEEGDDMYHLQLSKDADFADLILDKRQEENGITFESLEPGSYYMRVQAIADDGFTSLYSLIDSWKIEKRAELGPLAGSNEDGINLRWASMGEGIVYDLEISTNKNFSKIVVSAEGLVLPEYRHTDYIDPQTYYVRVRGVLNDGQVSPWTPPQQLTIESPPFSLLDAGVLTLFLGLFLI